MGTIFIYGSMMVSNLKETIKDFWKKEKGGSEIIATIVLIAIVVLLAVLFKEQLGRLVETIWNSITRNAETVVDTDI